MDDEEWAEYGHEEILQAVVRSRLTADDLDELCDDAGIPVLVHADGEPVTITAARTYRDAGVMTLDRGVWVELSDGSVFGLTVSVSRRPSEEVTLRAVDRPRDAAPPRPTADPHQPVRRATGSCGCACATGRFCGGCGHAGCAQL